MLQPWTCHCGQANVGPTPCSACLNAAPPGIAVTPVATPGRRPTAVIAVAVATAVLLVAGVVSAAILATQGTGRERAGSGSGSGRGSGGGEDAVEGAIPTIGRTLEVAPDSGPGVEASELERALPELMRFVQEARGLPFKAPVVVTLLPDEAFRARLKEAEDEDIEKQREELRTTQQVLEGLGLLEKGVDLEKAVESLYGAAVAGFYDPEKDDLVVRGDDLTVSVRTTVVHEFVHALQDQHFDIEREELDERDDEASTGFTGLVEGDAVRVERLYVETLSAEERKQGEGEEMSAGAGIDPDLPRILIQLVAFPYIYGPDFASAVFEAGGQERLDAAYAEPPATTEQLLHPDRFLDGEGGDVVETPEAEGDAIDQGVVGELVLLLILNSSGRSGEVAAEGWGGDRYIAWRDGDETCVRMNISMDSPQDDAELRQALDRLAGGRDGVDISGRGPFTVTSCG